MIKLILILLSSLFIFGFSCTNEKEINVSMQDYQKQSLKMMEVVRKLAAESDIKRRFTVARDLQYGRFIQCKEVTNQCQLYGKVLSAHVRTAKDGELTQSERTEIREISEEFRQSIKLGYQLLKKQYEQKSRQD